MPNEDVAEPELRLRRAGSSAAALRNAFSASVRFPAASAACPFASSLAGSPVNGVPALRGAGIVAWMDCGVVGPALLHPASKTERGEQQRTPPAAQRSSFAP